MRLFPFMNWGEQLYCSKCFRPLGHTADKKVWKYCPFCGGQAVKRKYLICSCGKELYQADFCSNCGESLKNNLKRIRKEFQRK